MPVVRLAEVAERLGISRSTAWYGVKTGKIPAWQPLGKGTLWYVPELWVMKSERRSESDDIKTG